MMPSLALLVHGSGNFTVFMQVEPFFRSNTDRGACSASYESYGLRGFPYILNMGLCSHLFSSHFNAGKLHIELNSAYLYDPLG